MRRVHLTTDRDTGRMRGFGFVEMETLTQEEAAISALDGAEWCGRWVGGLVALNHIQQQLH